MTKSKTAPAAEPSVADAERVVAEAAQDFGDFRLKIEEAESALRNLALGTDDDAYESKSIEIGRLRRAELRADVRLTHAREALIKAKAREEQDRRRALFAEGQKAAVEVEKLVGVYADHAAAIADTLRAIDKLRAPVETANGNLPADMHKIDADHALKIHNDVELPATSEGGEKFWWKPDYYGYGPLKPRPAILRFSNAVEALPSAQAPRPQPLPGEIFGERVMPDGTRVFKAPPSDWGTPIEYAEKRRTADGRKNITPNGF
jgi:hypothetical protein